MKSSAIILALSTSILATAAATAAPARPKTMAGQHPDLTGIWATPFRVHASGLPLMSGGTPWMAPSQGDPATYRIETLDELSAIADKSVREHHGIPIFGRTPPPPPPLTEAGLAAVKAVDPKKEEARELACYPGNAIDRGSPMLIVQNPKVISIQYEGGTPGRIINMDGRSQANPIEQWNGNSVGRWEGRTLKVHTVAIRGEGFGFQPRYVMDENLVMDEAYTLSADGKKLDLLVTLTDPTLYKEPLRRMIHYTLSPDVMVTDYTCTEGKDDMAEMVIQAHPIEDGTGGPPPGGPGGPPPGGPGGPPPGGPNGPPPGAGPGAPPPGMPPRPGQ